MNHGLTNALRWNKKNRHALTESKIYSLIEKIYASQSRKPFCGSVQTNLPRPANHRPFFRHPYYPPTPSLPIGRAAAVQLRAYPHPQPHQPRARDPNCPARGPNYTENTQKAGNPLQHMEKHLLG